MYDIIVIGGGIAGVYTTYEIHKHSPQTKILLIEKENRLGGRVHTYRDNYMTVESGAGRINGSQPHIMHLIEELGLKSKLKPSESSAVFSPSDGTDSIESSAMDAPHKKQYSLLGPLYDNFVDVTLGPTTLPNAGLILHLVVASKLMSKQYLQNHTLETFAKKVLTKEQVDYIKRSFGYYSELVIMNAYDAIKLLNALGPSNTFYEMKGGLDQIIEKMLDRISRNNNITVWKGREVSCITYHNPLFEIQIKNHKMSYYCQQCICALPKQALEKFRIFAPIRPILKKVECGSLCRIYSKFDNVWFKDLFKMTTDNDLRMILPYNKKEGTIMMSYCDNFYADDWQDLYLSRGVKAVNQKLKKDMLESTGIQIPSPKRTKVFYWECGVGYWGIGADSEKIAKQMIQPFPNMALFVCGENFSENGQQWVEGALETSEHVLDRLKL
jgi:monoamine oxidase